MASRGAIATMDKAARERITAASARLVSGLGVAEPPAPASARQPDLQAVYQLEAHATFLEAIANAVDGTDANAELTPPAEVAEAEWPAWYRKQVEKAGDDPIPALFEGETQKAYTERVATLPADTEDADAAADGEPTDADTNEATEGQEATEEPVSDEDAL